MRVLILILLCLVQSLVYAEETMKVRASECSDDEVFDIGMAMCMPLAMPGMSMSMLMLHGNGFLTAVTETGARGRSAIALPDMVMADIGTSVGEHHYLNLDFMGTAERWTTPDQGYPELLQIGEENINAQPFLDAQHPHSSPIMGLTLSDTIRFGASKDHLKIFLAPRGEATDGPIAFMHRATGSVNPDAPLGHHIGQDVGHITSSLVGESLKIGKTRFEFSTYHGEEPSPTKVDLPVGKLDSYSVRLVQEFSPQMLAMVSYGYVSQPEPTSPEIAFENRYSFSVYNEISISKTWNLDNTFIFGNVAFYDHASSLTSFAEEFLIHNESPSQFWGRIEVLQRTPNELQIKTTGDSFGGQWVSALSLGYTYQLRKWDSTQLAVGGSVTNDILPAEFQSAYNGNPWTEKVFLQFSGMKMWDL